MNVEYKESLIQRSIDNGTYPRVLYKYRTISQTKKILDNFSFWFGTPDTFNDPFDCGLSENQNPTMADVRKHFKALGIDEGVTNKLIREYEKSPSKLFELIKSVKEKTIYSKGVLSLSRKFDDILMWSHYAEYHKGVVFGLELESDLNFFVTPIEIDYKDSYEDWII